MDDVIVRNIDIQSGRRDARRDVQQVGGIPVFNPANQGARAAIEASHGCLAARRQWVCNEKRLLECAGLGSLHAQFAQVPQDPCRLSAWVETVAARLRPLDP